jgi:hypothetical protein
MTINHVQTRETSNSDVSACLVMMNIRVLAISCNAPILSLRGPSLDKSEILLRLGKKPTHTHLMN